MDAPLLTEKPTTGFTFDGYNKKKTLEQKGYTLPKVTKTGTTIAGIVFADGVILGADTRATAGSIVAQKTCQKIHRFAPNMWCCGAGTSADCDQVTAMASSQVELLQLNTGKLVSVATAKEIVRQYLFQYQGYVSAYLILGGVDEDGAHIYMIHANGCASHLPYISMGSGSTAAIGFLETNYKPDMPLAEGKKLVRDAVAAGALNDLGSGSAIDLVVITASGAQQFRPYEVVASKGEIQCDYSVLTGATRILSSAVSPVIVEDVMVRHIEQPESADAMDTN